MNTPITPLAADTSNPFASWKVDHVGVRVPNFDTAVAWYIEKLDFRLKHSSPVAGLTFALLSPAANESFSIELLAGPGADDRPPYNDLHASYKLSGWHHLGFRVDNVDQTVDELKRRGVTIVLEPKDAAALGLRVAFFADPWGNIFEVIESLGQTAGAESRGSVDGPPLKEYDIAANGISLHVTEQGEGPAVLFCHGFPDTSFTWRRQMKAIASAGYRAIAPDMRGYGRSSAPEDATLYTPLHTAGDLVGLLDALNIPSAVLVGHDWGATHAWNAALMRPDRFKAVFCLSVPYVPRGDVSVFERMRKSGYQNNFYMFEQMRPDADQVWADAAVTIPGVLYWASGSAPAGKGWSPMDPARSLHRPAPGPLPSWMEPDYVAHNVMEFQRTGFHGGLNYYRAAEPYFYLSSAWKGAKITQPSFYIAGNADGLKELYPLTVDQLRVGLPGLVGSLELDDVGHWVQHEAAAQVSEQLVKFLRTVNPA
jgi:pimeloyl-ACP methyl ester carboxylesterase/catechol 2,3-dioxygenase-like lactoylglutathione lyase family enzyme